MHGIPSHDTFSTVFRMLDPKALDAAFAGLAEKLVAALRDNGVIAIDGKALKSAYDKGKASESEMMVSAYATGLRLTLATLAAKKRNEIGAALEILDLIDLKGKLVTTDSLHCHRKIAEKITSQGGDYCFTLKGNQDSLLSDARALFGKVRPSHPSAVAESTAHGRIERRVAAIVAAKDIGAHHEFAGLKAFGRIEATREIDGKTSVETRYFALSRPMTPARLLEVRSAHWQIENGLHWGLDVAMREDDARNRRDNGPANIAVLRRRARDCVALDTSKGSLQAKLKRAGWDDEFLLSLLAQMR